MLGDRHAGHQEDRPGEHVRVAVWGHSIATPSYRRQPWDSTGSSWSAWWLALWRACS
jgi:hypothetical protein